MDSKILIILGIVFFIIRLIKSGAASKGNAPQPQAKRPKTQNTGKAKSIDDIFNEFVKEIENKKEVKKPQPVKASAKKSYEKKPLDWQQVDHTHIVEKKMLIDHEDYHGISHRIDEAHQKAAYHGVEETEGEVYEIDMSNIDWQQAIIAKEILDRKFA